MSTPKKPESKSSGEARVVVPRAWLITLATLLIVPWIVVGALYLVEEVASEQEEAAASLPPSAEGARGPWGKLTTTPIIVSPPLEYVAADWGRPENAGPWYFPGLSGEVVRTALVSLGVPVDAVTRLVASAQPFPAIRGVMIRPEPEIVRALNPEVRARLYRQLSKSSLNFDQAHSFRFFGSSPDEWFRGGPISERTRQLVEPLIYRDGEYLHFGDAELIRREIGDSEELQRLAKTLLRQSTLLVTLTVDDPAEVPGLAEYWGRGGRRTDIRPLLESIAGGGADRSIDIVHLLPMFARNHLYRYPRVTTADYDKPLLANCLWTSLNFFNEEPDDRYLDVVTALNALRNDYYVVEHGYQLGDIVAFVDAEGDLYHVAVYLADGLVYTKNGMSPVAPWTIMPLERLSGYYRHSADQRLIYHRRNGL